MLGLDISSSAVKLIELSKPTDTYRVEACSLMPLPANTVVEKNIIDIEGLADTIAKVVSQSKTQCSAAAVAVSGACVITKEIELPRRLTELQMKKQIEVEAGQYIPYPLEEIALSPLTLTLTLALTLTLTLTLSLIPTLTLTTAGGDGLPGAMLQNRASLPTRTV